MAAVDHPDLACSEEESCLLFRLKVKEHAIFDPSVWRDSREQAALSQWKYIYIYIIRVIN